MPIQINGSKDFDANNQDNNEDLNTDSTKSSDTIVQQQSNLENEPQKSIDDSNPKEEKTVLTIEQIYFMVLNDNLSDEDIYEVNKIRVQEVSHIIKAIESRK